MCMCVLAIAVRSSSACRDNALPRDHYSGGASTRRKRVIKKLKNKMQHYFCVSKTNSLFSFLRFHVDLMRGHDVVFHFNPRFYENIVVRNTQLGGCWGPEERDGGFPFVQGRQFEVQHPDLPLEQELKGIVTPTMIILPSFIQPNVVANLYEFLCSV